MKKIREYKKVSVETLTKDDLKKMGFSRSTVWRILKRGYYCPGYHEGKIKPSGSFNPEMAYKISEKIWRKHFSRFSSEKDDMIQESVVQIFERSGLFGEDISEKSKLISTIAYRTMLQWIRKNKFRLFRETELE